MTGNVNNNIIFYSIYLLFDSFAYSVLIRVTFYCNYYLITVLHYNCNRNYAREQNLLPTDNNRNVEIMNQISWSDLTNNLGIYTINITYKNSGCSSEFSFLLKKYVP